MEVCAVGTVVALNDLSGVPARGGDPCAGPYGHRLRSPLQLADPRYTAAGDPTFPGARGVAGEDVLMQFERARLLMEERPGHIDQGLSGLSADFEKLRWFPLPTAGLAVGTASGRTCETPPEQSPDSLACPPGGPVTVHGGD